MNELEIITLAGERDALQMEADYLRKELMEQRVSLSICEGINEATNIDLRDMNEQLIKLIALVEISLKDVKGLGK